MDWTSLKFRKEHTKFLMNHVKYLIEKTSCGKDQSWIQCHDGNIPLPLLLIVSISPMCRKAVSNLGMLDQQIVIVLPDIYVGEFLLFLKYLVSVDTNRFYNKEDVDILRKVGDCLELDFDFCNVRYQITHAKRVIGKIRLQHKAKAQQSLESGKENSGPKQSPQFKKQKVISHNSTDSNVIIENNASVIHNSENSNYQNMKNIADSQPTQNVIQPVKSSNYTTIIPHNQRRTPTTTSEQNSMIITRNNYMNQAALSAKGESAQSSTTKGSSSQIMLSLTTSKSSSVASLSVAVESSSSNTGQTDEDLQIEEEFINKPLECAFCLVPVEKTLVLKHLKSVHPELEYGCMECKDVLPNRIELQEHVQDHPGSAWFNTCQTCNFVAITLYQLKAHRKTHFLKENGFQLNCKFCNKVFIKSAALKKHEDLHTNGKLVKTFQCPNCPKIFSKSFNLARHIRSHFGIKSYSCDMCNADFVDSTRLKEHKWTHLQHSRFRCPLSDCAKEFKHRSNLRIHMTQDHEGAILDGDNVQCDKCNKTFAFQYKLRNHLKWHQMEEELKKKEKTEESVTEFKDSSVYVCSSCKREFKSIDDLGTHCKEYHNSDEKSSKTVKLNLGKSVSKISTVGNVTEHRTNIIPNNASVVNCTVTPMDTAYAELAVNVPVSIPGGCSRPDPGSSSISGAKGSDILNQIHNTQVQDVQIQNIQVDSQIAREKDAASIYDLPAVQNPAQSTGNMPSLYGTEYKECTIEYKDCTGNSVQLDAETKHHLQTLGNIRLENLVDKSSQRLEFLNDIISKEMDESQIPEGNQILELSTEDEFDDI